jgi:hypothetical protein
MNLARRARADVGGRLEKLETERILQQVKHSSKDRNTIGREYCGIDWSNQSLSISAIDAKTLA